jgi:hypothetical protein
MTQYLNALNPPLSVPMISHRVTTNTSQATLNLTQAQTRGRLDQRVRNRMTQQVHTSIDQVRTQVNQLKNDNEPPFLFTLIAAICFLYFFFFILL